MHGSPSTPNSRGTPSRRGKSPRFSTDSPSLSGSADVPSNFSSKPRPTFASCLNIRVEGAIQIDTDSEKELTARSSEPTATSTESKRAPRKSKTEALVALNNQARSMSPSLDESEQGDDFTAKYKHLPPIPVAPRLDLTSVKTSSPRRTSSGASSNKTTPRPFGLEDCPEYYPTLEDFKDPMNYIRSIAAEAKAYGICKIIPPEGWKMPFVTDTETFRFRTRLQRLNSIEASSRAKLNFLEQLYRFHKQQGNSRVVIPTINHKPVDLWLLRKEVQKLGGYDAVTKGKKWSDLGRLLGYRGIPGLSTQLKNSYARVILPYEHFCDRAKNIPTSPISRDPHLKTHVNIQASAKSIRRNSTAGETSPLSSPLTASSSPLSEPPDDSEYKDASRSSAPRPRRSTRVASQDPAATPKKVIVTSPVIPSPIFYDKRDDTKGTSEQHCEICHKKNRGEEMLLCDGCDCGFHMFCLDPPLDAIPKDQWFCYTCLSGTGGDFGFDEGEEHSLSSFQARDLEFRKMWFETHPPPSYAENMEGDDVAMTRIGNVVVSEYDVEQEFWRLVQSAHETVEVEYGADVHSTTHGSAMPTMETHPLDPSSKDPWNLNNIPIVSDSLLRYIKSDISGMTVPWTYVGMVFSTFCWHNEDHYTYSINFMHWGETKTWYGIPGEDAEKFESAIKCEAPDLFEVQPDLLFQLVTMMNPQRVTDSGVRVYACNQRPGEFVITFPKAYHAGFNHGLNFNEAVNFALPDWLPFGRECVQRYREHRKLPVFSHDELLITITQQSQSIKTALWLTDNLQEMVDRELTDRKTARDRGYSEVVESEDRAEDQYQCTICKTFCYLSQITCQCTAKVVCVEHAHLLCDHRPENRVHQLTLRKRFTDADLQDTLAKVKERAGVPTGWRAKLQKLLQENARPSLRSLRAVLADGDRINYPLPEMTSLRKCVTRANEWVDSANTFLTRKQSRKRSRKSRGRLPAGETATHSDDPGDRPDRGLDELYALIQDVDNLGFDCGEIASLRNLAQQSEDVKAKANELLQNPPAVEERNNYILECKRLIVNSSNLNVHLDELIEIEKIVDREQLVKELEEKLDDDKASLTIDDIRQLLARAQACNIPPDNKHLRMLENRQMVGRNWEEQANAILAKPVKTIAELDEFAEPDPAFPFDPEVLDKVRTARAKARDFDKQAKAWLNPEPNSPKPKVQDVSRFLRRAEEYVTPYVQKLVQVTQNALQVELECDKILRNQHTQGLQNDLESIRQWKEHNVSFRSVFSLPSLDKLDGQFKLHDQWITELPWYCHVHNEAHRDVYEDVMACTDPDDDDAVRDEYLTCICSTPVHPPPPATKSDAVQCDHCAARFHGECAKNGGSCPFCDHHHWNGAIRKERNWHFAFLPAILHRAPEITKFYSKDWKELETIIHRIDRLSCVIGQFLSFTSKPENQTPDKIQQVRHFMRKLYKIQFAVSPTPEISFGLDLAGLHRILAGPKRKYRPRFVFAQDVSKDSSDGTRCFCRSIGASQAASQYSTITCDSCKRLYHQKCVHYVDSGSSRYQCPICCLRKNKRYPYCDVRVLPPEMRPGLYVDIPAMMKAASRDILYTNVQEPYDRTVFVQLMSYTPPDPEIPRPVEPPLNPPAPYIPPQTSQSSYLPPGQPWSRWGAVTTPSQPPSTQRRQPNSSRSTPQPSSRKRKHAEEVSPIENNSVSRTPSSSSSAPPKRRALPPPAPSSPPPSVPTHPVQTLSPSLAMIVSPVNQTVMTSPRSSYVPPQPSRSGSSVSPLMHHSNPVMTPSRS